MGKPNQRRPTWLTAACPAWCATEHAEDDHPEDRIHRTEAAEVAAVVGRVDDDTLAIAAAPTLLIVQRTQHVDDPNSWLLVTEADDTSRALVLSPESAERLARALTQQLG